MNYLALVESPCSWLLKFHRPCQPCQWDESLFQLIKILAFIRIVIAVLFESSIVLINFSFCTVCLICFWTGTWLIGMWGNWSYKKPWQTKVLDCLIVWDNHRVNLSAFLLLFPFVKICCSSNLVFLRCCSYSLAVVGTTHSLLFVSWHILAWM